MKISKKNFLEMVLEETQNVINEQVTVDPSSKPQNSKTIKVGPNVPQDVPQMVVGDDHQPYTVQFDVPAESLNSGLWLKKGKGPQELVAKYDELTNKFRAHVHVFPKLNNGRPLYSLIHNKTGQPSQFPESKLHTTPEGAMVDYLKLVLNKDFLSNQSTLPPESQKKVNNMRTWPDSKWLKFVEFGPGEGFLAAMKRALKNHQSDNTAKETEDQRDDPSVDANENPGIQAVPDAAVDGRKPGLAESFNYVQTIIKEEIKATLLKYKESR